MAVQKPVIPAYITVHLGRPDQNAENVTVSFNYYVKNVASSEIYPTWPESALRANIYVITTFALNRIFTEWYPSRGYPFDITSSTAFDQAYKKNREIYENISVIVDEIYNDYIVRQNEVQPFFTQFCNGTTAKCDGLSQWGTVALANRGYTPYEILKYYYGDNINIIRNAPVQNIEQSYPGTPLRRGSSGNDVKIIASQLNRIGRNYPAIPKITTVNTAIYDAEVERAVRKFQEIFELKVTGTVDKSTWYKIKRYYVAVKRLSELSGEGLTFEEASTPYPGELRKGTTGIGVYSAQTYLNIISYFNPNLSPLPVDSLFGDLTENAVKNFQSAYSLPVTGIIDRRTWNKITSVYGDILNSLGDGYEGNRAKIYPGYVLTVGTSGNDVRDLQSYLSLISKNIRAVPNVTVDGVYGEGTAESVRVFQSLYGLPVTGYVGPATWYEIEKQYNALVDE